MYKSATNRTHLQETNCNWVCPVKSLSTGRQPLSAGPNTDLACAKWLMQENVSACLTLGTECAVDHHRMEGDGCLPRWYSLSPLSLSTQKVDARLGLC